MNPPPGASKLQWPIAVTPKEWMQGRKRLQHLSPHLLTAIYRIQPFQAESPGWNCLHILHDLARLDRHRAPHELAMWPEKVKGSFRRDAIHDLVVNQGPVTDDVAMVTFTKIGPEELSPEILDLDFEFGIDVRDVELAPHPETGQPTRPWGSLDKRLHAMRLATEEYAEGLLAIAENPDILLSDDEYV